MHHPKVVAISGPSASGKTLFASKIYQALVDQYGENPVAFITEDSYYRDQANLTFEQRCLTNYDVPKAFEHELLIEHLRDLKQGHSVNTPQYCFKTHARLASCREVMPAKVILLEGILLLTNPELMAEFDISVFMDTPLDVCLVRRIRRDVEERGRSIESVLNQYESTVRPAFFDYISPKKQWADIVVTGGGMNEVAIDIIRTKIQQLLSASA